jgi:hypothetical protein
MITFSDIRAFIEAHPWRCAGALLAGAVPRNSREPPTHLPRLLKGTE